MYLFIIMNSKLQIFDILEWVGKYMSPLIEIS